MILGELACTVANRCLYADMWLPPLIPIQYQGWAFFIFATVSVGLEMWGFYYILTNPVTNETVRRKEKVRRK